MDEHDLLILVDATASMSSYLRALRSSIPQIISISALTGGFARIGLLAYRDYDSTPTTQWSGWFHPDKELSQDQPDLLAIAKELKAVGGWDTPEATKTGFATAYELMRSDAKTLIFHFADAPPHPSQQLDRHKCTTNGLQEMKTLRGDNGPPLTENSPSFVDWVSVCKMLSSGPKKAQVFPILSTSIWGKRAVEYSYYHFMAAVTGGVALMVENPDPATISRVTVDVLLAWMRVEKAGAKSEDKSPSVIVSRYVSSDGLLNAENEDSEAAEKFLTCSCSDNQDVVKRNTRSTPMTTQALKSELPKKETASLNFSERWKTDECYKSLVVRHLLKIIEEDVQIITINPVFGSLWRALCNDKDHPGRLEVLNAFSAALNNVKSASDKEALEAWLEESYDFSADVLQAINSVPQDEQFPCVFLDPTINFGMTHGNEEEVANLTRKDLLEIGRSCNASILRRISRVLTHLTFARSEADIPEHITKAGLEMVPRIPLALSKKEYNREFWKILLHLIVPGTFLSARPAALVAALSIRLGMTFLNDAAIYEMLIFKNHWNNIETPETWTLGCLSLLIDADKLYQKQLEMANSISGEPSLLGPADRELFEKLISLKILESNLDRAVVAKVPWTPEKSISSIGPQVICTSCQHPRSVTILGANGKCGICYRADLSPEEKQKRLKLNVSHDCSPTAPAAWVECINRVCRAQYVVYATDELRVRPKCYFCRFQLRDTQGLPTKAPTVECRRCLNRMIWPEEYRPDDFAASEFLCPPCTSGRKTITEVEATPKELAQGNGYSWLLHSDEHPPEHLLQGRSVFHVISLVGVDKLTSTVSLLPSDAPALNYKGKPIHNTTALISTLRENVANRKITRAECSLCFSTFPRQTFSPACGRRGCFQRVCNSCLEGWYGLNSVGHIINTAALSCPFCRRLPVQRTLMKYGKGIHAVRNLSDAVTNRGTLIYAWCTACSSAKELMERHCADGAPPAVSDWICGECLDTRERARVERRRMWAAQAVAMAVTDEEREEAERRRDAADQAAEELGVDGVRPCPGCGTLSQRISGCGHIMCPVEGCGKDWCWFCGVDFPGDRIYAHMDEAHGGFFGGDFEDEEVGDDFIDYNEDYD